MISITYEELLKQNGKFVYKTKGVSMEPMLHQNRDLVVISKPSARLKPFDVALYRRGTNYVLHRVIKVRESDYLIRGDNTYYLETVPDTAIIGVLTAFKRKGKYYSINNLRYRAYVHFWCVSFPIRSFYRRLISISKRIIRKLNL